jgi:hypothetical protein
LALANEREQIADAMGLARSRPKPGFSEMPVLLHSVPQRLPSHVVAAEDLKRGTATVINPFDAPLARRCAILENICRLSAGLDCLRHHGSGSEELPKRRRARGPAAPPRCGGWGIEDEK